MGCTVAEALERISHREYLTRLEIYRQERERETEPSRADWYSMQVALRVREIYEMLVGYKRSQPLEPKDFKLKLVSEESGKAPVVNDPELALALHKAKWGGLIRIAKRRTV